MGGKDITITTPGNPVKKFTFDYVFGDGSQQIDVYNKAAKHTINDVLDGYNGTIFAYGEGFLGVLSPILTICT